MKNLILILAILGLAACGGGGDKSKSASSNSGSTNASPSASPPGVTEYVDYVTFQRLINDVRADNGAGPLSYNAVLAKAAQAHADDMQAKGYFSHDGLDGSDPGDRITAAGYNWRAFGENIAEGQVTESEVLVSWTTSPGHHANNIDPSFEEFGLAKAGSGWETLWVLVLATKR